MSAITTTQTDETVPLARAARRKLGPMLTTGLVLLVLLVLVAIFVPVFLGEQAGSLTEHRRQHASSEHILGTDEFGRDLLARALVATRLTLILTTAATGIGVILGVVVGLFVWLVPKHVRNFVLGANAVAVAFPGLVLALVIASILGTGAVPATIAVGAASIPAFVRLSANMAAPLMERDYVSTARLLNVPRLKILFRHVLPNLGEPLLILSTNSFVVTLTELSGLSFIGLGVQNPQYDFGRLLADALPNAYTQPIQLLGPSVMLVLTGAAAMFIGDGLAARSNPRLRRLIHGHHSGNLQVAAEYKAARTTSQEKPPVNESENEPNTTFSPKTSALFVQSLNVTTLQGASLVKNVTLDIGPGEILGLVGESGSGKSLTAMSAAGLIPDGVNATAQILQVAGHNLLDRTNPSDIARDVAMVYQDPMSSFNPALSLGSQLTEVPRVHLRQSRKKSRAELVHKFRQLQISNPEKRVSQRAHELSGGMLQRAMISSALLTEAKVIIADEPTTALDVTVQAEVLRQFVNASESLDAAVLFISHDLGVIGALCDRVLVMKEGEVVEELTRTQLHHENIRHPYTKSLLEAAKYVKPLTEPDANR